jgi:hypothetical protein
MEQYNSAVAVAMVSDCEAPPPPVTNTTPAVSSGAIARYCHRLWVWAPALPEGKQPDMLSTEEIQAFLKKYRYGLPNSANAMWAQTWPLKRRAALMVRGG